ncbi:MAG: hypothetical protein ABI318_00985, partial [Chthoniobacteraceae bacterium]
MRTFLLALACIIATTASPAKGAEPFEIKDGDRVLFLGDTLLEREGTYGYLETRMAEQFPDRKFTVRNLAMSADTPLGWSRASFDPPAKGFERLKEQVALVRPTVVFLGYGMAASLQEMTDRSQDWTLNRDPARYGAEPMSAARFKKELAQCMDAIVEIASTENTEGTEKQKSPSASSPSVPSVSSVDKKSAVRFVLLSPIRHEDLRATRPGLPDPAEHNKLLEQYTKAIEELAKERGARFVNLRKLGSTPEDIREAQKQVEKLNKESIKIGDRTVGSHGDVVTLTENGIHMGQSGYAIWSLSISEALGWTDPDQNVFFLSRTLRAAIIRKNELFFHRWRPANETYLFGFRKREQGKNGAEIPMFDPLIEKAEAEIERLKKAPKGASTVPASGDVQTAQAEAESDRANAEFAQTNAASGRTNAAFAMTNAASGRTNAAFAMTNAASGRTNATFAMTNAAFVRTNATSAMTNTAFAMANAESGRTNAAFAMANAASDMPDAVSDMPDGASKTPKKAAFQLKTPVLTSAGQLYAANDAPATGKQPPVTSPDLSRQTPAETPDLSKVAASPSVLPRPDFTLADGLEISLWAENPLLAKPTECNWDAQGRLWVSSSALYPMIAPGQVADDKIIILEDPGHTGHATKSTVFADGLLIPTGVAPVLVQDGEKERQGDKETPAVSPSPNPSLSPSAPARWGCYVGQSTELLYFEDTDGDGKADKKRIVFSGFGTEDTHHIVHTLRWGPDGRLYFSQSVYIHTHMETPWGV